ncbi:DUF3047 domain-containing protein [Motilimonas cestriensis]|uniref:DUF3047 domain-containing protein n=1 Tax=Motilimonas cestriensis TaxID=2742685 RepID=A0ABS8WCM8_9GAMM|nr:DUF3047 domain-containing protein [Motilimonas cestriensis]MCE2596797.1 DUF3047 domain-containing protein [Motilimonas cestriensis]
MGSLISIYVSLFFCLSACFSAHATVNLTDLANKGVERWTPEVFSGQTSYSVQPYKGRLALKAVSHNAASGLVLKQQIDLLETPYLNWSWLAEKALPALDERSKSGDDYIARIYLVIEGGLFVWRTKSISYVWSSNQAKGQVWNNAYAGSNLKMIALRGKEDALGQWHQERRNIYQDLITHFGDKGSDKANRKAYRYIDVIAIMTDTDNSASQAESYYGEITLSD